MTVTDAQVTWLTQEAYDRLKAELDKLIDNRPVIAAEINARREEGDLKENGGYHAAREEQGQQEGRIRQLQELLRTAHVGTAPTSSDIAQPGMVLKLRYEGDDDTETVLLGSREEGSRADLEVVSPNSPPAPTVRRKAATNGKPRVTVSCTRPAGGSCFSLLGAMPPSGAGPFRRTVPSRAGSPRPQDPDRLEE